MLSAFQGKCDRCGSTDEMRNLLFSGLFSRTQAEAAIHAELNAIHYAVMNPLTVREDASDPFTLKMVKQFIVTAVCESRDGTTHSLVEICHNCGSRMPEGCKGLFKNDGGSCLLNKA